jgi:hypothetical protein
LCELGKIDSPDLSGIDLTGQDLTQARLLHANLSEAILKEAKLDGVKLDECNLTTADLTDASLQAADLTTAIGLGTCRLSGADLKYAKIAPNALNFDTLARVDEISKNAGIVFISMLTACVFSWITISNTLDPELLLGGSTKKLPLIQADISTQAFFTLGQLVLLVIYLYFHLYMQRLWEMMAVFPAVFPDGTTLDRKTYPWLMNDLVRRYLPRLRKNRLPLFSLQEHLTVFLGWWLVPITLITYWLRYPGFSDT